MADGEQITDDPGRRDKVRDKKFLTKPRKWGTTDKDRDGREWAGVHLQRKVYTTHGKPHQPL